MKWFGGRVAADLTDEMNRRLRLVGEMLASQVRRNISISTRSQGPSVPGEFPHADTGNLRKSVTYDHKPKENSVEVGTPVEYARPLEKELDRSFLERTLHEELDRVKAILTKPMGKRLGGGRVSVESMDITGSDE